MIKLKNLEITQNLKLERLMKLKYFVRILINRNSKKNFLN